MTFDSIQAAYRKFFYPSVQRITEHDDRGYVLRDGVQWTEERSFFYGGSVLAFILAALTLSALLIARNPIPDRAAAGSALAFLLFIIGSVLFSFRFKKRALIFTHEGLMQTPFGFPGFPFRKTIDGHHRDIDSIGIRLNEEGASENSKPYNVMLYGLGGEILALGAGNYHHDYAYRIARQINLALDSFR